jgi:hypothetical protein
MHVQEVASVDGLQRSLIYRWTVILTASALATAGVGMEVTRIAHAVWLHPAITILYPLKFKGALQFIAGAIGTLAAFGWARRLAQISGLFMIPLSGATILECLIGRSLDVHQAMLTGCLGAIRPIIRRIGWPNSPGRIHQVVTAFRIPKAHDARKRMSQ